MYFDSNDAPCGSFTFSDDLALVRINRTLAATLGMDVDDAQGRSIETLLTSGSRGTFHHDVLPALRSRGEVEEVYLTLARSDGAEVPVLLNGVRRPPTGATTDAQQWECVVVRMFQGNRLHDQLVRVRKAAEQAPGVLYQLQRRADGTMCFPYASEGIRRIYGVSPAEVVDDAHKVFDVVHPDDLPRLRESLAASARTMSDWRDEHRVMLPDGGVRWVEGHASPEARPDGSVLWHGYVFDVTERKGMEAALAAENELTRVTLRSIGDAVITTDASGHVEYMNPTAERMTGWLQAEAAGRRLLEVFHVVHEDSREVAESPVDHCLRGETVGAVVRGTVLLSRDGREYAVEDSAAPIRSHEGALLGVVMVFRDVSEQRRLTQEFAYQATHDPVTGLLNRAELDRRLQQLLHDAVANGGEHSLCYIDLDQFKVVNETCGHAVGDRLLLQVAELLTGSVRARDPVARLGGDEFALLLVNCPVSQAQRIAQTICDRLDELRFQDGELRFRVGASIGVAPVDKRWSAAASVLQAADSACYAAKSAGRGRVQTYNERDEVLLAQQGQMQWATRLQLAIEEDRLVLMGQPIQSLHPGRHSGLHFEVLIRLQETPGVLIPPGAFIPAAERYGLAMPIDRWVLTHVCGWMGEHRDVLDGVETIAVNLSGASVGDRGFHRFVGELLDRVKVPVEKLCFELTETAAITNLRDARAFFDMLHARGARIALDDFGSGMSSMAYLKHLPVDYVKIDGQFVKDMAVDELDFAMVRAINDIAHLMGKSTIAEFVENEPIMGHLRALGVDYAQGYHLGRPMPIDDLLGLL